MQARPFEHFLKHLASLTRRQRERLLAMLIPAVKHDRAVDGIEQARADRLACPHCQSRQLHRHARYLANYLGWRWALDGGRIGTPEGLLRAALGARRQDPSHT